MDNARVTSVGFLKSSKVRNAEEAIGQSEGLLTVLRLTQADIKPAEDALLIAKRFFDSNNSRRPFTPRRKRSPSRSRSTSASVYTRRQRRGCNRESTRCVDSACGRKNSRRSSRARRR